MVNLHVSPHGTQNVSTDKNKKLLVQYINLKLWKKVRSNISVIVNQLLKVGLSVSDNVLIVQNIINLWRLREKFQENLRRNANNRV